MEIKIQVPFQQLLILVKSLSPAQKARLRREIDEPAIKQGKDNFLNFLLEGPVYTEKEIAVINKNRKSISEWRTKN